MLDNARVTTSADGRSMAARHYRSMKYEYISIVSLRYRISWSRQAADSYKTRYKLDFSPTSTDTGKLDH